MKVLIAGKDKDTKNYQNALTAMGIAFDVKLENVDVDEYDRLILPGGGDILPERFGCGKIGKGLQVTMIAKDGTVEAIEHISLPIIGVQWHPERTCFEFSTAGLVDGAKLLRYFLTL